MQGERHGGISYHSAASAPCLFTSLSLTLSLPPTPSVTHVAEGAAGWPATSAEVGSNKVVILCYIS